MQEQSSTTPSLDEVVELQKQKLQENLRKFILVPRGVPEQYHKELARLNRKGRREWLKRNKKLWKHV